MNQANFQGMSMAQMGMHMGQPQMGMTQPQMGQPQMAYQQIVQPQMVPINQPQMANPTGQQQQILQYLRSQKVSMGWQQTCRLELRLSFILQITTQLNLLRADTQMQPLTIAIEFERKQFEISPDQMTYEGKCREKLQHLTAARHDKQRTHQDQNAPNPQISFGQPQMGGNAMFIPQPQFQQPPAFPQVQQPIPNPSIAMPQQQAQPQARMQMRNGIGEQQVFPSGQSGPNQPQQTPQPNNLRLTHQDQEQIQQIAQNMVANMTQQDKHGLQQTIMGMQPHLRQSLSDRGTNLGQYVIKQRATQAFLQQRARIAAQTGNQGTFSGAGIAPRGGPNAQGPTTMQVQQTPQFEQPGSMDHIVRQQQDALHHQQEGQVVVPANTGQRAGNPQRAPSRVQKTPQQVPQAVFGANRPIPAPSQTPQQPQSNWNQVPKQTPNLQHQTPQMPQPQNFSQIPGQPPQPNPLQGQAGGLSNALRTPQQNPQLPTLNQPLNPQNQSQKVSSPNPVQQTPNLAQRSTQNSANGHQRSTTSGQQHPTTVPNMLQKGAMPIAMQQHIAGMKTDEEKRNFIMMMRQRQQLQRQQLANNNNMMAQPGQGRGQPPQSGSQNQTGTSQPASATGTQTMHNRVIINAPQASMVPPNQGTQQSDPQNNVRASQLPLNEAQEQQMDAISYPDDILNSSSVLARMPGHVKNWGQLKQWVAANAQNLPPDSLQKLKMLQARHYQKNLQDQRKLAANQGQPMHMPQQPSGPAPSAHMYSNGNAQPSMQQGQALGQANPTMQEIQRFKASLPDPNVMSDEQIQRTIMIRKRQDLLSAQPNSQTNIAKNQQLMQEQYAVLLRNKQLQQARHQGLQAPQQQPNQTPGSLKGPQFMPPQGRIQTPPTRQNQVNQTGQAGSKPQQGVKRNSNDDVVEVPDPKLAQHQARQPPTSVEAQPPALTGQPRLSAEQVAAYNRLSPAQIASLTPQHRAALETQRGNIIAQTSQRGVKTTQRQANLHSQQKPQQNVGNNSSPNDSRAIKIKQLRDEVMRTMSPRQTVPMSSMERENMIKKLGEVKGLLTRIDASLPVYFVVTQNEARVREILKTQLLLASQFRDSDHNPVENFTISFEEFRNLLGFVQKYMTQVSQIVQQNQQKAAQNKQPQQSQVAKVPAQDAHQTQQLSAANLQQQQDEFARTRKATLNKAQNTNKPPAAPTTSHVPFPFGAQSPQGVPQIYVPKKNELTQDKLQLPSKRHKKNLATSAGVVQATAMSPKPSGSPESQRLPTPLALKCTIPDCKSPAFASKALLEKHIKDVHEVKDEQITDPLDYVLGGLRMALNLDGNGNSKHIESQSVVETHPSPAMKISASSQGFKSIKQEAATPTSKPVAGLRTPQTKPPTPTPSRETGPLNQPVATKDPWANAHISQHWFSEVFRDVADPNRALSPDFFSTWLEAQGKPEVPSDDSPQSTDKNSPHKSDISATDNLNIKILGEDGFLTKDWFDMTDNLEAMGMAGLVEMDWSPNSALESTRIPQKDGETSEEWLKVFAPEKSAEGTKTKKKPVQSKSRFGLLT